MTSKDALQSDPLQVSILVPCAVAFPTTQSDILSAMTRMVDTARTNGAAALLQGPDPHACTAAARAIAGRLNVTLPIFKVNTEHPLPELISLLAAAGHLLLENVSQSDLDRLAPASLPRHPGRILFIVDTRLESEAGLTPRSPFSIIRIPSLRERRADIGPLIEAHLPSRAGWRIEPDARRRLESYSWPGESPQLEAVCAELVKRSLATGSRFIRNIDPDHLVGVETETENRPGTGDIPFEPLFDLAMKLGLPSLRRAVERRLIDQAVRSTGGSLTRAARLLGVPVTTLFCRRQSLRLNPGG